MASPKLEQRVAALESEVARLKQQLAEVHSNSGPWWEQITGTFADDRAHAEAMRLGSAYRESLRPRSSGKRKV